MYLIFFSSFASWCCLFRKNSLIFVCECVLLNVMFVAIKRAKCANTHSHITLHPVCGKCEKKQHINIMLKNRFSSVRDSSLMLYTESPCYSVKLVVWLYIKNTLAVSLSPVQLYLLKLFFVFLQFFIFLFFRIWVYTSNTVTQLITYINWTGI